jgi:hypothetical protein
VNQTIKGMTQFITVLCALCLQFFVLIKSGLIFTKVTGVQPNDAGITIIQIEIKANIKEKTFRI